MLDCFPIRVDVTDLNSLQSRTLTTLCQSLYRFKRFSEEKRRDGRSDQQRVSREFANL